MEEKYNAAIVGCGVIAQAHLKVLKKLRSLKVVAVCDIDKKKAIATSEKWKIDRYYRSYSRMLNNEDISIVSILTPPSSHSFLAVDAIKHGMNVVIEKPLTMTTTEADSIVSALRKSKSKMIVVYHWLFTKAMLKALSLIRERQIGEVLNVDIRVTHNAKEDPMASDANHWCHNLLGGRFGEMLPHPVYILQSVLSDNLTIRDTFVSKRGDIPWMRHDELYATLQSEKGYGSIYISLNSLRASMNVDIYGTKEILKVDLSSQSVLQLRQRALSKFHVATDSLSIASSIFLSTMENALDFAFKKKGEYSISNVYTMLTDCIKKDTTPLVTPEMAYHTVRVVEEICRSI